MVTEIQKFDFAAANRIELMFPIFRKFSKINFDRTAFMVKLINADPGNLMLLFLKLVSIPRIFLKICLKIVK